MDEGTSGSPNMDELNLLDYCRVVWKRRGLIAALCVGSILISTVYSLWAPKLYRATATILPPMAIGGGGGQMTASMGGLQGEGVRSALLNSLSSSGGLFSFSPSNPTRDIYIALLNSRTMREEVIEHFKKTWGPSVGSLVGLVEIASSKQGIISVMVEAHDPKLPATVANFYLENLSTVLSRRAAATAELQIEFYERQLDRTKRDLKKAQTALVKFSEKHRVLLSASTKRAIAAGAAAAGGVMALEMERNLKRMYLTDQHPEMIALSRRIYESKKLISHQLYGEPQALPPESPGSPPRQEFFVATTKMTPLQFKLAEVYRDLSFRQSIENSIHQNLESLKYSIDNPSSVYIDWLDRALPPGGPFKPNVSYNVAAAGVGSLIIGILLAFFLEYIKRVRALEQLKQQTVNSE